MKKIYGLSNLNLTWPDNLKKSNWFGSDPIWIQLDPTITQPDLEQYIDSKCTMQDWKEKGKH